MTRLRLFLAFTFLSALAVTSLTVADVLHVRGRFLTTPCGDTIILRGVNKQCIYEANNFGIPMMPEMKKTGVNVLRIVWDMSSEGSTPDNLDKVIQACIDNAMIPMVELHDATGDWSKLPSVVDYWLNAFMVNVIKKHQSYILVNIANEPGNIDEVTDQMFLTAFKEIIPRFRAKGIEVPLVLDAIDYGQKIDVLLNTAAELTQTDPQHNLIFSFHAYWQPKYYGDSPALLKTKLKAAVDNNVPLIIGEFTGCYTDDPNSNDTLWKTIVSECDAQKIGWIAWEWGPGNADYSVDPPIPYPKMDMTSDGTYNGIKSGWATEVLLSSPHSIKNTAVTPDYIIQKGNCIQSQVESELPSSTSVSIHLFPNPVTGVLHLSVDKPATVQIYNSLGHKIVERIACDDYSFDTTALESGEYVVVAVSNTSVKSQTFIVLR